MIEKGKIREEFEKKAELEQDDENNVADDLADYLNEECNDKNEDVKNDPSSPITPFKNHKFFCSACNTGFNRVSHWNVHLKTKKHQKCVLYCERTNHKKNKEVKEEAVKEEIVKPAPIQQTSIEKKTKKKVKKVYDDDDDDDEIEERIVIKRRKPVIYRDEYEEFLEYKKNRNKTQNTPQNSVVSKPVPVPQKKPSLMFV